jgi:phage terminase large subunit-like protein
MTFSKTSDQVAATKLLASGAKYNLLYGGSRSGKTFLLVYVTIIRALKAPDTQHAIFRLHFNHAKQSVFNETIPNVMRLCFPNLPVTYNQVDCTITFHNGSSIVVGGLDDKERTEKILGLEFSTIYLNEASQIPFASFQLAQTRLAQKSTLHNKFYVDCNPPTKSHWIYKFFIKKIDPVANLPHAHPDNYVNMRLNPEGNRVNLSDDYITDVLGNLSERQRRRFLLGEFLDDNPYALFKQANIDANRLSTHKGLRFTRVVVGVDPAVTSIESSDSTGIVVCATSDNGHYYVLADYTCNASPLVWAGEVIKAYHTWKADRVIGEVNNGGDLIATTLRTIEPTIPFRPVHATRGKAIRAEPIAALYEQGKVHHVGALTELEDQMCEWVPNDPKAGSPDRMDAMVWAITELMSRGKMSYSIIGGARG